MRLKQAGLQLRSPMGHHSDTRGTLGSNTLIVPKKVWDMIFFNSPNMIISMPSGNGSTVGFPFAACFAAETEKDSNLNVL